jgi:hypothetical protein
MNQDKDVKKKKGSARLPSFFPISLLVLFLCLILRVLAGISFARELPATSEATVAGAGRIVKENIAHARNEAISQACRKAIEDCLIERLGYQGVANNFQRIDEEILSQTSEQIQDYEIISEFRTDKYVKVLMKVRINLAVLERRLERMGLYEAAAIQIAVVFLVSEKKEGLPPDYWWGDPSRQTSLTQTELSLSRVFEGRGFRVMGRSFFPPEESYDESMLSLALGDEQAVRWGRLLSAQVVVTGEANLYGASRASVFLKAIKVMNGAILAQGYREGTLDSKHEIGSAVEVAIDSWANDMLSFIVDAFRPAPKPINQIILLVKGLKSYRQLGDLKEFLTSDFPEVRSVLERTLKRDLVRLSAEVKGDSRELAEKVLNHRRRPFAFEINEIDDQGFTVMVR